MSKEEIYSGRGERRRERRVEVEAPLLLRRSRPSPESQPHALLTHNISLAGVYFEVSDGEASLLAENEVVVASVAIPESQRRVFPFTRLAGRGRVVRVKELGPKEADGRRRLGIALEFADDVTALTAISSWS